MNTVNIEARKKLAEMTKGQTDMSAEIAADVAYRKENKAWLTKTGHIASSVLHTLDALQITKNDLADKIGISLEEMTKILRGHENLTLQTITKMESALGIELINVVRAAAALKAIDKLNKKNKPKPVKS